MAGSSATPTDEGPSPNVTAFTETDIGRGLGTDYFLLRSELTPREVKHTIAGLVKAVHTFEGNGTIQTLIVGRDITGVSALA